MLALTVPAAGGMIRRAAAARSAAADGELSSCSFALRLTRRSGSIDPDRLGSLHSTQQRRLDSLHTASRTVAEPAWAALCAMARPLAAPVLDATVVVGAVASDTRAETITTVSGCRERCGWAGSHLELSRGVGRVWSSFADGSQLAMRPFACPPAWL